MSHLERRLRAPSRRGSVSILGWISAWQGGRARQSNKWTSATAPQVSIKPDAKGQAIGAGAPALTVDARGVSLTFQTARRRGSGARPMSICRSPTAISSPSSARRAAARPRCCASSPILSSRPPARILGQRRDAGTGAAAARTMATSSRRRRFIRGARSSATSRCRWRSWA